MWETKPVVILDGGTGMTLAEMGHSTINDDLLWSAAVVKTNPEDIIKLHKKFFTSGSDIVVTATYQASIEGYMKRFSLDENEALELIKQGVTLAKEARDQCEQETGQKLYVAASIGPYGATLGDFSEYHGRYADTMSEEDLSAWHLARLKPIMDAKPDLLAIETIPVVKEARAILATLSHFPGVKAWVTYQCKDGSSTGHGDSIVEAVQLAAKHPSVIATGVNCVHPKHVSGLLQNIKLAKINIPVIVKPNGGQFEHDGSSTETYKFSEQSSVWLKQGASWLGGCCHIYAEDIHDMKQSLKGEGVRLLQAGDHILL